jgi:hypothetical protein
MIVLRGCLLMSAKANRPSHKIKAPHRV